MAYPTPTLHQLHLFLINPYDTAIRIGMPVKPYDKAIA